VGCGVHKLGSIGRVRGRKGLRLWGSGVGGLGFGVEVEFGVWSVGCGFLGLKSGVWRLGLGFGI